MQKLTKIEKGSIRNFFLQLKKLRLPYFIVSTTLNSIERNNIDPLSVSMSKFFEGREGMNCVFIKSFKSNNNEFVMDLYVNDIGMLAGMAGNCEITYSFNDGKIEIIKTKNGSVMMS